MYDELNTEEGNFNWVEWDEYVASRRAEYDAAEAAREARMNAFMNYEMASFESFCNFGVVFVREFYPIRWIR